MPFADSFRGQIIMADKLNVALGSDSFKLSECVFVITDAHNINGFKSNIDPRDLQNEKDAIKILMKEYKNNVKIRRYEDNFKEVKFRKKCNFLVHPNCQNCYKTRKIVKTVTKQEKLSKLLRNKENCQN